MAVLRSVRLSGGHGINGRNGQAMRKKIALLLMLTALAGLGACREKGKEPMIEELIDPEHPEGEPAYGGENVGGESSPTPTETYP